MAHQEGQEDRMTRETRGRKKTPVGKTALPTSITREQLDEIADPPDHLTEDGMILWYKLHAWGGSFIKQMDDVLILEVCEVYQEKELLRRMVDLGTTPRWIRSGGTLVDHPAVRQLKDSRAQLRVALGDLGFTPTDRAKMGITEDQKVSTALEEGIRAKFADDQARKARQAEARARRAAAAMASLDDQDNTTEENPA